MNFKIRAATGNDREQLSKLHEAIFSEIGATRADGEALLTDTTYHVWVAQSESGALIGYAVASHRKPGVFFSWLGVLPVSRKSGVGSALMTEVHDWARSLGEVEILLDTRNRFREAIRSYLKHNYGIVGSWVGSDGELMIRLRKTIE